MLVVKVALVFLLALVVGAEKKIELQDIEEDNLRSEKEKDYDQEEGRAQTSPPSSDLQPLDFLKNGLLRYFEAAQAPQQPRYVQQYAVTEPSERPVVQVTPKAQYGVSAPAAAAQHAMVGYYSNVPMQIYLVPQYYNEPSEQANTQQAVQYAPAGQYAPSGQYVPSGQHGPSGSSRVAAYQTAPDSVQPQTNYVEVPATAYVTPSGKAYIQQYSSPVAYVTYAQPTIAPAPAHTSPVVAYQMPVVQYPTAIVAPPVLEKGYYQQQQYTDTNSVDEGREEEEGQKQYATQQEEPYNKPSAPEYPRYYNSRAPVREEYRHGPTSALPPPNPLLLKPSPPHLAHLPKALPMVRPLTKPVYATGNGYISSAYTQRPSETYGIPYRRRPSSLLDSYIPSSLQVEYLKRGYTRDPLAAYEALSSARQLSHLSIGPRHYERGFLPNQMYHTAAGGITYGHYKRTPKGEKVQHK